MARLERFSVDDLVEFSADLRTMADGVDSMEAVSQRIADYLRDNLCDDDGEPAAVMVSLHKTQQWKALPPRLQAVATEADPTVEPDTACLALLARSVTVDLPEPTGSELVRPLTPAAFEEQPIFVRLLSALGVDEVSVLDPTIALEMRMQHRELNVYVENDLVESGLVDDEGREQLELLGIRSILAIGGILPSGDLFLVAVISRARIDDRVADLLRSLGTAAKVSLIPFTFKAFGNDAPG